MNEAPTTTQKGAGLMLKKDVKIGTVYDAKISGTVSPVRIRKESPYGGWEGINLNTGRVVRIKSAQKLRGETRGGALALPTLRPLTQEDLTRAASKDAAAAMTARHFQIVADILKKIDPGYRVVLAFADELAATNPRFDRARFLRACSPIGTDLSRIDSEVRAEL